MPTETGDDPFKRTHTVSPRARKAVKDYLEVVTRVPANSNDSARMAERLSAIPGEIIPAFTETLEADRIEERLASSFMLLHLNMERPGEVLPEAMIRIERIILDIISGNDVALRLGACFGLLHVNPTSGLFRRLLDLRGDADRYVAVLAAAALARDPSQTDSIRILENALADKDDILASFAAVGMLKLGIHSPLALAAIRQRLPDLKYPVIQTNILLVARELGQEAKGLSDPIARIAENESADIGLRQMAVCALAAVGSDCEEVRQILVRILKSPHVALIMGAVEGLDGTGTFSREVAAILAGRLTAERKAIRHVAAYGLSLIGPAARAVKSIIIQRLGEEPDIETCWRLSESLAQMGPEVVDDLLEVVREGNIYRLPYVGSALVSIGGDAARRIAELVPSITDERVYETLIDVLGGMGKHAAPAMPVLAKILNETSDDNLALFIVRSICHCGRTAEAAVPALIRCVADRGISQSDIGIWAERALSVLREHSVPAMKAALLQATGLAKEHLEQALSSVMSSNEQMTVLTGGDQKTLTLLKSIDVELLLRFVAVGTILEKGAMSWRNLSVMIINDKDNGLKRRGLTSRNLADNIAKLSTLLGVTLTTHGNQKKGALTAGGEQWLTEVREYLRQKDARRRSPES